MFLTYEGEMPPVEVVAARCEAVALLAAKQWNRIIVDLAASKSIKSLEALEFVKELNTDSLRQARVALVVHPDQVGHLQLIMEASQNNGVTLSLFSDVESATVWVKGAERIQCRHADKHP